MSKGQGNPSRGGKPNPDNVRDLFQTTGVGPGGNPPNAGAREKYPRAELAHDYVHWHRFIYRLGWRLRAVELGATGAKKVKRKDRARVRK